MGWKLFYFLYVFRYEKCYDSFIPFETIEFDEMF